MQWDKSERNTSEKSTLQTSPNWRVNLPKLEGALFQGLVAWRIIFFYFQNHFLKIHTRGIPKMSDFYVFSHLWLRKRLSKKKKRVLTPSFPQPTSSSKWVGEPDYSSSHQRAKAPGKRGQGWMESTFKNMRSYQSPCPYNRGPAWPGRI